MSTVYELGPFRLDAEAGVLSQSEVPVPLGPRGVAVLRVLVERASEHVTKEDIIDAAWPGVVVEEGNLAVQISAIRRVLARNPGGEHWIETLARRGYRFVGPVKTIRDDKELRRRFERSNLPEPLTSFIGRERELVEIKRLLPGKRLLTLVGMGGIGKTRLALQAAAEVVDAYRDGVWLVEFGSIRDPLLVPTSVAQVLGVKESAGAPLTDALCSHLKTRQSLLILDNCEHLLDACARLADAVLRGAADATIIATSREPLQVVGEQTYALQPLSLPDSSASAERMRGSEAVQLFLERVRRQLPEFEPTPAQAPVVAELCIHLDGIPLALELAAARAPSLSIEQINSRLHDRFRLLTRGSRTALPRQQTLRATLDWSYDLLAEQERIVLRRLAVFPATFTLDAASAVASDAAIGTDSVPDLLAQLVARSMILADTNDVEARYRLLETTRAYALENLVESGEVDVVKRRHAQHFRERFEHWMRDRLRLSEAKRRAFYLTEVDNVRVALDWALGSGGDPAIGVALAGGSMRLWTGLSLLAEGRQHLEAAVSKVDATMPLSNRARFWLALGKLRNVGAPAEAAAAFESSVELFRQANDPHGLGDALVELARICVFMGHFEQAASAFTEAFPLLVAGPPGDRAFYFESFGFLKMLTGDFAGARTNFDKALSLYRDIESESKILAMRLNLADMTWALGDLDAALAGFGEAVALMRKTPHFTKWDMLGVCLTNLAGVHTERGELVEALAAAKEGLPLRRELDAWSTLDHLALRAALAGKVANAARIAGCTDFAYKARQSPRQPNETRARDRLHTLLREKLTVAELERLLAEGAKMTEDEACAIALEE